MSTPTSCQAFRPTTWAQDRCAACTRPRSEHPGAPTEPVPALRAVSVQEEEAQRASYTESLADAAVTAEGFSEHLASLVEVGRALPGLTAADHNALKAAHAALATVTQAVVLVAVRVRLGVRDE